MKTAMQRKRELRAVAAGRPAPIQDDLSRRALAVYPDGPNVFGQWVERDGHRVAWVGAVRLMRARAGGSNWIMDAGSIVPKWQAGDGTE